MKTETPSLGLVVLNMGGPDSLAAIQPFLYNLFSDRELIQLPAGALLQKPFAWLISRLRTPKVRENYRMIGGKTPQLRWTTLQAAGIATALGPQVRPYVAMRYWHPRADATVQQMAQDGITEAVVLSLYPHYTGATSGSSIADFERAVAKYHPTLKLTIISQWYDWPGYLDALAHRVKESLETYHELMRDEVQILFSAHALPQKFIDRGDPYLDHVLATVRGVMKRVGERPWHLAFQSRSGPVQWMEPGTLETLDKLAAEGHRAVLLVPVSFVSDHIETLVEIDDEFARHAHSHGITEFGRTASLNDHPDFIAAMAALVRYELEKKS
ncbi:MAG: ferrochelatase [Deltaproteobacteria bacterium HGW-Deltaproteobacteria-4]|nr:MAG: ferrochelatase [Deltaproteobacteria bacterium HGW-Deltaproteobacteria-4]